MKRPGRRRRRRGWARRATEEVAAEAVWQGVVRVVTYPVRLVLRGLADGFDLSP